MAETDYRPNSPNSRNRVAARIAVLHYLDLVRRTAPREPTLNARSHEALSVTRLKTCQLTQWCT
jgi:hypothetical protein